MQQETIVGVFPAELAPISKDLHRTYTFVDEIARGKTGVTYRIRHVASEGLFCLKTISPDVSKAKDRKSVKETLRKEVEILDPLSHRCLPQVYERSLEAELPFYVCTYHPGKTILDFKDAGNPLPLDAGIYVVRELMDTLSYLHRHGRTHCDFHYKNLMISDNTFGHGIMIIDFGSGHRESDTEQSTLERGDMRYKNVAAQSAYRNRVKRKKQISHFVSSDFKALGHMLALMHDCFFHDATPDQRLSYRHFCARLQDGEINSWDKAMEEFDYVVEPTILYSRSSRLFISEDGTRSFIPLPVTDDVPVGEPILSVVNTTAFQRLRFTKQLSFCEWFFPGGTHTRFEHSLGVLWTTRKALKKLATVPAFRDEFSSYNIEGLLLASLVHDIGHYPFAHVLEHFVAAHFPDDEELKDKVSHSSNTSRILAADPELRQAAAKNWSEGVLEESIRILEGDASVLSDILDGPVDTDKIDYLRRDSHHCGLAYGNGIDVARIVASYRCVDGGRHLGISRTGVSAVEGMMIAQEQLLSSVYWQPHIRGITAMFHAFIARLVKRDRAQIINLVTQLQQCISEQQAVEQIIFPRLEKLKKQTRESLMPLVNLHREPRFLDIYKVFSEYHRMDRLPPRAKARHTIYHSILTPPNTGMSTVPISWDYARQLKNSFMAAFREKHIEPAATEIIVDVPWGKVGCRQISVVDDNSGDERDITEESHLNSSIFSEPTAFLAPIRVFVSPRLSEASRDHVVSIRQSAAERFYNFDFEPDDSEEVE